VAKHIEHHPKNWALLKKAFEKMIGLAISLSLSF